MSKIGFAPPFLKRVTLLPDKLDRERFPFTRFPGLLRDDFNLEFSGSITFFTGENGTGKSTILEAIATLCGFHIGGGGSDHQLHTTAERSHSLLAEALRPSWLPKVSKGFFFRSDTFAEVARYLDDVGMSREIDGRRLHEQSHGESMLSVFVNRFGTNERRLYLLDEPENALSPTRQLSFLRLLRDWERSGNVQVIIATHSPIIMSYPGATNLCFDGDDIAPIEYENTEHYKVTRAFLGNPERYFQELFGEDANT